MPLLVRRLVRLGGADGTPSSSLAGSPSDPGRAVGGERLEGPSDETRKCLGCVGKEVALFLMGDGTTEGSNPDLEHSLTWSAVGRRRRKSQTVERVPGEARWGWRAGRPGSDVDGGRRGGEVGAQREVRLHRAEHPLHAQVWSGVRLRKPQGTGRSGHQLHEGPWWRKSCLKEMVKKLNKTKSSSPFTLELCLLGNG